MMKIPVGQQLLTKMMAGFQTPSILEEEREINLNDEENQGDIAMDYGAMGMDMPLCKVADMSNGAISEEMVEHIVEQLNQKGF